MSASDILSTIAPQYDTVVNRDEFITLATMQVNTCWFDVKSDYAIALMTAHLISIFTIAFRKDGTGGAITSKREGDLAISFSTGKGNDDDLDQTTYGKQFQRLMKGGNVFLGVTGGNDNGCGGGNINDCSC